MFEIEMKAHVLDRKSVIEKLNSFAEYKCFIQKDDSYYRVPIAKKQDDSKNYKSARIRHERVTRRARKTPPPAPNVTDKNESKSEITESFIFTYKQEKEVRQNEDGTSMEVNRELECEISDPEPLVKFFLDLGGERGIVKQKIVECYHAETECGTANIELCTVPPLGDFLEIEIIADKNDDDFVAKAKKIEEEIFLKCGIPLEQIEPRYYSDMLQGFAQV